jgi:hypothetical protein
MDYAALLSMVNQGTNMAGDYANSRGTAQGLNINADLNDLNAQQVLANGEFSAHRIEERGATVAGAARMGYAKGNVRLEGSPLMALANTERNIRLDVITTRLNAAKQASSLQFTALQQRIAAGNERTKALLQMSGGFLKMAGSAAMMKGGSAGGTGIGSSTSGTLMADGTALTTGF